MALAIQINSVDNRSHLDMEMLELIASAGGTFDAFKLPDDAVRLSPKCMGRLGCRAFGYVRIQTGEGSGKG